MAGCSSSSGSGTGSGTGTTSSGGTLSPPTGCTADPTVSCTGGADGFSCAAGDNPENYDSYVCSDPTPSGSDDLFCCFTGGTWSASTCNPDDSLTIAGCSGDSYGFVCAAGDDPTTYDPTLVCSTPTPDGSNDDFCCVYGSGSSSGTSSGGVPTGCTIDSSVNCTGSGADGYSCAAGDNPENYDNLVCSDPTPSGSDDLYCCFADASAFSQTTCYPDDGITSLCSGTDYGFQCASGDDPTTYDSALTCSINQPDPDGVHDDFCCTY